MGISAGRIRAIGLCLLLALWPVIALAQARYDFHLPAQPLDDALRAVGRKAHVTVAFDPVLVAGKRSPTLKGTYTPREALERLLRGSRLRLRVTEGGSYWVEAIPVRGPPAG